MCGCEWFLLLLLEVFKNGATIVHCSRCLIFTTGSMVGLRWGDVGGRWEIVGVGKCGETIASLLPRFVFVGFGYERGPGRGSNGAGSGLVEVVLSMVGVGWRWGGGEGEG